MPKENSSLPRSRRPPFPLKCYAVKYKVLLWTGKWAKYVDRDVESQASFTVKALEYLPNRLTLLYSEIHYEEKNYLKVKTELLIYPSPPYSKGLSILRL